MSENLSILERNIVHALEAYDCADEAASMFLRGIDRHGVLASERRAYAWGDLADRLTPMLDAAHRPFPGDFGVRDFIRVRFENMALSTPSQEPEIHHD